MLLKTIPVILFFILFSTASALAADGHRPYIGAQLGAVFADDNDAGLVSDMDFETGFGGAITAGYDHGWRYAHARSELELSYRQSDVDGGNPVILEATDGKITALSLMLNLFYSIETGNIVTPYFMGGLGAASLDLDNVDIGSITVIDDSEVAFAYQVGAGLDLAVTDNWTLDLAYRYFGTADKEFERVSLTKFDYRYESHNTFLGLRYKF